MKQGIGNPIIINICGDIFDMTENTWITVFHSDTMLAVFKHGKIVCTVTKTIGMFMADVHRIH